jgi:hypothetical protein
MTLGASLLRSRLNHDSSAVGQADGLVAWEKYGTMDARPKEARHRGEVDQLSYVVFSESLGIWLEGAETLRQNGGRDGERLSFYVIYGAE